jgi:hypothetical protein
MAATDIPALRNRCIWFPLFRSPVCPAQRD